MKLLPQVLGADEGAAEEGRVLAVRFPQWLPRSLGLLPARVAQDVRNAVEAAMEQVHGIRTLWPFSTADDSAGISTSFASDEPADPRPVRINETRSTD
ncbi:hypothetical protein ACXYX3_27655 (plasmid) [Mycobacterium sp. C3-094]